MMLILVASSVVVFMSLPCNAVGIYSMRCSNSTKPSTTLKPSDDGVRARYIMEWCTDANPNDTLWKYDISFDRFNRNPRLCTNRHSAKDITLDWTEPLNCDYVCLSTPLDLVFNSSYTIKNWFPRRGSLSHITNHRIANKYRQDDFSDRYVKGSDVNHGDYVSVHYFLNNIPAVDYEMFLCHLPQKHEDPADCRSIMRNCSTPYSLYEITCKLQLPDGRYKVTLLFNASWTDTELEIKYKFDKDIVVVTSSAASVAGDTVSNASVLWAVGALAALCALAALLLLALRCRRAKHFQKQVLRHWVVREESKPPAPVPAVGPILLLYAREGAAAAPVVAALRDLLEAVAPGQVYDICDPATLAESAAGGPDWIRSVIENDTSRVVLLQTPALQLHAARLQPALEQPLLSRTLVYRAPAPGDWLLQFALRLLQAAPAAALPAAALPYRKYYLATLEGLETEALPYTVPFRRYVLPRHATTLLRDLAPAEPILPHAVDSLARAVTDFVDHARAHPDYLMDELMVVSRSATPGPSPTTRPSARTPVISVRTSS